MRSFRDRDYIQTKEGYFFCVVGPTHPEDRVIAYLKYVPDPSGKWGGTETRFRRVLGHYTTLDLLETLKFLEKHPEYLYDSPVLGIRISAVPMDRIASHLKPEEKLCQFISMDDLDVLQRKAVDLAALISDEAGIRIECFGVTGSLLLDIHQDFSDIDLIVYGARNAKALKEAVTRLYEESGSSIRRFGEERLKEWALSKARMYPLTYEEAVAISKRKWGQGRFRQTMFSVHPVKLEEDALERYGDKIFKPEGMMKVKATVSDASEADFLPSVYKVEDVAVHDAPIVKDIHEVVSYEGFYGGIAEKGERILAYGKLERVINRKNGEEHHRILVGSKEALGRDYIKPA